MRAPLSIVIPTLNAQQDLPDTLACLMEGLSSGLIREVIISDGGSQDATAAIADEAGAVWLTGAPGRGGQLRRGAELAQGDWLLFLHADTHLAPNWSEVVWAAIGDGTPAYFKLQFRASGLMPKLVAGWANLRSRLLGLPYGDQGLLISRDDYNAVGGFDDVPLMEDVSLVRRLPRLRPLPSTAATSAERYEASGWIRRGGRNLFILTRYFFGADPQTLAAAYRRR